MTSERRGNRRGRPHAVHKWTCATCCHVMGQFGEVRFCTHCGSPRAAVSSPSKQIASQKESKRALKSPEELPRRKRVHFSDGKAPSETPQLNPSLQAAKEEIAIWLKKLDQLSHIEDDELQTKLRAEYRANLNLAYIAHTAALNDPHAEVLVLSGLVKRRSALLAKSEENEQVAIRALDKARAETMAISAELAEQRTRLSLAQAQCLAKSATSADSSPRHISGGCQLAKYPRALGILRTPSPSSCTL